MPSVLGFLSHGVNNEMIRRGGPPYQVANLSLNITQLNRNIVSVVQQMMLKHRPSAVIKLCSKSGAPERSGLDQ
jgi:hypothetical protein